MNKRYLGIDYGSVRIGLAVSDPLGLIATGFETLNHRGKSMEEIAAIISEIIAEKEITDIVLGLPKRTDGKVGEKEELTRQFAEVLKNETGLEAILQDERFTTVIAHQYMNKLGTKAQKKKSIVDQVAAEILLQSFLDKNKNLN